MSETTVLLDAAALDDDELAAAFARRQVAPESFRHRQHVRLAWVHLRRARPLGDRSPLAAVARYDRDLKRFAAWVGKPGLYHETITWSFLFLIRERMALGREATFQAFAVANPDLLDGSALRRLYRPETLQSESARAVFVLPDGLSR